jgi:hypothetical protein
MNAQPTDSAELAQQAVEYDAWPARVARMGRKIQRETDQSRSTTRQLASKGRWS